MGLYREWIRDFSINGICSSWRWLWDKTLSRVLPPRAIPRGPRSSLRPAAGAPAPPPPTRTQPRLREFCRSVIPTRRSATRVSMAAWWRRWRRRWRALSAMAPRWAPQWRGCRGTTMNTSWRRGSGGRSWASDSSSFRPLSQVWKR